jgi:hypothetical protein
MCYTYPCVKSLFSSPIYPNPFWFSPGPTQSILPHARTNTSPVRPRTSFTVHSIQSTYPSGVPHAPQSSPLPPPSSRLPRACWPPACHHYKDASNFEKYATNSSPDTNCEHRIPVPKIINRKYMTGTKQLLGHLYRLLDLLRQMRTPGRPTPTNSTGKKHLPGSITGNLATGQVRSFFILHPSSSASNYRRNMLTTCSWTPQHRSFCARHIFRLQSLE